MHGGMLRQAQHEATTSMACPTPSPIICLILSLTKDAGNYPAQTFVESSIGRAS